MSVGDYKEYLDERYARGKREDFTNSIILLERKLDQAEAYGKKNDIALVYILLEIREILSEVEHNRGMAGSSLSLESMRERNKRIMRKYLANLLLTRLNFDVASAAAPKLYA